MFSIRRFLLASLLVLIVGGGVLLGTMTYLTLYHELDEQFDAELVQSAHLLARFLPAHRDASLSTPLTQAEHRYQRYFVYQVWQGDTLVSASEGTPTTPLVALQDEPHLGERDGWHSYALPLPGNRWLVLAESDAARRSIVDNMTATVLAPYVLSLPVILLLVWLAIRRGLAPLAALTASVSRRTPENLSPLVRARPVRELEPLHDALNALLTRLEDGIAREKRFTADAAHELRTLLMVLRLHADNAVSGSQTPLSDDSLLQMQQAITRAERMLEQLLVLARLDPLHARMPEINRAEVVSVARDTLASLVPLADQYQQQLQLLVEQPIWVSLPPEALHLLLRNLVDNACRYAAAGDIAISAAVTDDTVILVISDAGDGLSEAQQKRFSERFSRGSGVAGGAGLGLSIVDGVLSLYGGTLRYRQREGDTTAAAILSLPAASAGSER